MTTTSKLDTIVYFIEDGQVKSDTIRSFDGYIDVTTTPHGVAPRNHVRGNELWTWGHAGNFPKMISRHETEAEAQAALEEGFVYDFWHQQDFMVFATAAEAERALASQTED
jgi:hypothetical protein